MVASYNHCYTTFVKYAFSLSSWKYFKMTLSTRFLSVGVNWRSKNFAFLAIYPPTYDRKVRIFAKQETIDFLDGIIDSYSLTGNVESNV